MCPSTGRWGRLKTVLARNDSGVWGDDADEDDGTIVLRSTEQTIDGRWSIEDPAIRVLSSHEERSAVLAVDDLVVTEVQWLNASHRQDKPSHR